MYAEDGSGAVFFGPSEIERANELKQQKEQDSYDILYSRQESASKKVWEEIKN